MKQTLNKYKLQILVAVATTLFIFCYPLSFPVDKESVKAFWSMFGFFAFISFLLYTGVTFSLQWLIKKLNISQNFIHLAHAIAIIIGYSILAWAFYSLTYNFPKWM